MLKKKIYLFIMLGITFLVPIDTSTMAPQQISKERAEISNKIKQADTLAKLANLKGAIDQLGKHSKSFAEQLRKAYQQKEDELQKAIQAQKVKQREQVEQKVLQQARTIALQQALFNNARTELKKNEQHIENMTNELEKVEDAIKTAQQANLNLPVNADERAEELTKRIHQLNAELDAQKGLLAQAEMQGVREGERKMQFHIIKQQEANQEAVNEMQAKIDALRASLEKAMQAATPAQEERLKALEAKQKAALEGTMLRATLRKKEEEAKKALLPPPVPVFGTAYEEFEEKELPPAYETLEETPKTSGEVTARLEEQEQEVVEPAEREEAEPEEINALKDKLYNFITGIKADGFNLNQQDESKIESGINNVFSNIQQSHSAEDIVSQLKIVDSDISKQVKENLINKIKELFPGGRFSFLGGKAKVIIQELNAKWSTILKQQPPLPPREEQVASEKEVKFKEEPRVLEFEPEEIGTRPTERRPEEMSEDTLQRALLTSTLTLHNIRDKIIVILRDEEKIDVNDIGKIEDVFDVPRELSDVEKVKAAREMIANLPQSIFEKLPEGNLKTNVQEAYQKVIKEEPPIAQALKEAQNKLDDIQRGTIQQMMNQLYQQGKSREYVEEEMFKIQAAFRVDNRGLPLSAQLKAVQKKLEDLPESVTNELGKGVFSENTKNAINEVLKERKGSM